jgi:hypothetical protein
MNDLLNGVWSEIAARPGGPMAFRFYLQPMMAFLFAVRDGLHDARTGKPAYFWALLIRSADRAELLWDCWKSVRNIFVIAAAMDLIYQLLVLHGLRPVQTLAVAVALAIIPYVVLRGPANRLATLTMKKSGSGSRHAA